MTRDFQLNEDRLNSTSPYPDDDLYQLFDTLDGIHASDELKAATFERLGIDVQANDNGQPADAGNGTILPLRGAKAGKRPKLHAIRIAAIAACLSLVAVGSAYAIPFTHETVTVGDTGIDLGVNVFGITVSAQANDEKGQQLLDEGDVRNMSFEDSVSAIEERYSQEPGFDSEPEPLGEADGDRPADGQPSEGASSQNGSAPFDRKEGPQGREPGTAQPDSDGWDKRSEGSTESSGTPNPGSPPSPPDSGFAPPSDEGAESSPEPPDGNGPPPEPDE